MDQGAIDWAKYHAGEGDRPAGYNGEGGGGGSGSSGSGSFSYPDIQMPSITGAVQSAQAPINDAFSKYLTTAQSQATPLQMYTQFSEGMGIPQLRKTSQTLAGQVADVEDSIRRVKQNNIESTRESLLTEGQRQNMQNADRQPLLDTLAPLSQASGRVNSALADLTGEASRMTGFGVQGNEQQLDPYKTGISLASDYASRLVTGFTADAENKLRVILDKIDKGFQLTMQEKQQAAELSKMKLAFDQQSQSAVQQAQLTGAGREIIEVGGHKKLIDKTTGQVIQDLGKSGTGSGTDTGWIQTFIDDWNKKNSPNGGRPDIRTFEEEDTGIPNDKNGDGYPDSTFRPGVYTT